jgi:hypothetical protein
MKWRYSGLVLVLIALAVLPRSAASLAELMGFVDEPSPLTYQSDIESILATGQRVPLECFDISTLELLRGVSDTLALKILESREEVRKAFNRGASEEDALQRIRGVGPATARTLARYIRLDGECLNQPTFQLFAEPLAL